MQYLHDHDYSQWLDRCEKITFDLLTQKCSQSQQLDNLQDEIIKGNNAAFACFFAMEFPSFKPYKMQKVIFDTQNVKYALLFAQNVKNADIKALQKLVIKSKQLKFVIKFASVPGSDHRALEKIILKSQDPKCAYLWIKNVKDTKISKFKKIIFASKNPQYLFELAKHLTNPKDIALVEDLIIQSKSFTYLRLLASKIKSSNMEKLEQAVLDMGNIKEIKKFAKAVKKSKMKKFLLV